MLRFACVNKLSVVEIHRRIWAIHTGHQFVLAVAQSPVCVQVVHVHARWGIAAVPSFSFLDAQFVNDTLIFELDVKYLHSRRRSYPEIEAPPHVLNMVTADRESLAIGLEHLGRTQGFRGLRLSATVVGGEFKLFLCRDGEFDSVDRTIVIASQELFHGSKSLVMIEDTLNEPLVGIISLQSETTFVVRRGPLEKWWWW